jgi:hypothetical protein
MKSMRKLFILLIILSFNAMSDGNIQMKIVEFNGLGQPSLEDVKDGDVLVLYKPQESVEVVKLKILPPDDYGPELTHAKNENELGPELKSLVESFHPQLVLSDRHWTLTCPESIADRAVF